jgi:hypothetical protein
LYYRILDPLVKWREISKEAIDLFSWKINLKDFEIKATLAQLVGNKLNKVLN